MALFISDLGSYYFVFRFIGLCFPYVRLRMHFAYIVVVIPSTCYTANWTTSFDSQGWSKCGEKNLFITAIYRSASVGSRDIMNSLEEARCFSSTPSFSGRDGVCVTDISGGYHLISTYNNRCSTNIIPMMKLQKTWFDDSNWPFSI